MKKSTEEFIWGIIFLILAITITICSIIAFKQGNIKEGIWTIIVGILDYIYAILRISDAFIIKKWEDNK